MGEYSQRATRSRAKGAKGDAKSARRRSPGEGSVYPTKDGRWRGAVTWTNPDGSQGRRFVSGATQGEARAKVDDLRHKLRIGTVPAAGPTTTVADYLGEWLERDRMRVRPSTWLSHERHVRLYLIPLLGRISLERLAPSDVEHALTHLLRQGRPPTADERGAGVASHPPVDPRTANHVRATLRTALSDAVREGLVVRNAARDARPPYVPHKEIAYLGAADARKLIEGTRDLDYGPIYAVAVTTGLRLGELLALRWHDVTPTTLAVRGAMSAQIEGGYALGDTKTAKSRRTIPLPATAREALEVQRTRQTAHQAAAGRAWQDRLGLVFTDEAGQALTPRRVSGRFHDDVRRLDIPPVRFHDLRHSAATLMLAEGVPLVVVSEWLGHSSVATTAAFYVAVVPELKQNAAAAMDRALGPSR